MTRTGGSLLVLLSASVVLFTVIRLIPGDPITILLGSANIYDPELVARTRIAYGLDQPLPVQYLAWMSHMLQGDFGRSLVTSEPVAAIVGRRLGPSLLLGLGASSLGVFIGLGWGIAAGYVTGTARTVLRALPMLALVVPTFSVGLVLVFVFAVQFGILPASGLASPLEGDTPSLG